MGGKASQKEEFNWYEMEFENDDETVMFINYVVINSKFGMYPAIRVERLGFAHLIAAVELQTCLPEEQTMILFKVSYVFNALSYLLGKLFKLISMPTLIGLATWLLMFGFVFLP